MESWGGILMGQLREMAFWDAGERLFAVLLFRVIFWECSVLMARGFDYVAWK